MEIKEFYNEFITKFNREKRVHFKESEEYKIENEEWTKGISNYIYKIFKKTKKYTCICKNDTVDEKSMKEFLSIDFMVFETNDRANLENLSTQLAIYAIEHENRVCHNRIAYNISKLLNVKANNKVMIGYVEKTKKKTDEKELIFFEIEKQIKKISNSYFGEQEKLLVVLGENGMKGASGYTAKLYNLKLGNVENI